VLAALAGVAVLLAAPAAARGATWVWPVHGRVLARFAYHARIPFARGQRRGVDLGAPAGTPVVAACPGRVRFAGSVGTAGRAVSTTCGAYVVSYLHLDRIAARRGARLSAGDPLGTVGTTGRRHERPPHLSFGVRLVGDRWGYVDPMRLVGHDRPPPPALAPVRGRRTTPPLGPAPAGERRPPAPSPERRPEAPAPAHASPAPGLPLGSLWLSVGAALALAALGAPLAGVRLARRRRARRTVTRPASLDGRTANW
jgi:murein DD-endopeptidase MepM/ murein hydrolase activator NlpD